MLYILTCDRFLYNGLKNLYGDDNVTRPADLEEVKKTHVWTDALLVDTLCCSLKGPEYLYPVQALRLSRIIFLCSFRLSRFQSLSPVLFLPRNIHPKMLSPCPEKLADAPATGLPALTLTEYEIITRLIHHQNDARIASELRITVATLRAHKFRLMLKLKLRKMSHITHTEHYAYIQGGMLPGGG